MLAAIPYTTFPEIDVGPLSLRTFGVMVALGVVLGTAVASRWAERHGVAGEDVVSLATRMVLAGLVGARITWVLTHLESIDTPLDIIAVWEGGLQFSGGFLAALVVGVPVTRRWPRLIRWRVLDGCALGLTVGLAIGRIGCYSVGEHLGGPTSFFLGTRYEGGRTIEGPLVVGETIHNTSLYELLHLVALAGLLWYLLRRRRVAPSMAVAVFILWYGAARFLTDFLRTYDDLVLGLTGAQWMSLALIPVGLWLVVVKRPRLAALAAAESAREATEAPGPQAADPQAAARPSSSS